MAEKRMFTQKIIDSDAFLDMPITAQALYFHLNMRADDDGFVNNPKKISRYIGTSEEDLELLIAKRFLLCFESGVVVIKHWRMHNTIRKDRYNPTQYQEELAQLEVKSNFSYTENVKKTIDNQMATTCQPLDNQMATTCQPDDNQMATQYSIDKYSIDKGSIDKESIRAPQPEKRDSPTRSAYGEYKNVYLSDAEFAKLQAEYPDTYKSKIERLSSYMESSGKVYQNHFATIRNWAEKDKEKKKAEQQKKDMPYSNPFLKILREGENQ